MENIACGFALGEQEKILQPGTKVLMACYPAEPRQSRMGAQKRCNPWSSLKTPGEPALQPDWQRSRGNQSPRRREEKWHQGFARNDRRESGPSIHPNGP